jgi:Uma2 family endonuclease
MQAAIGAELTRLTRGTKCVAAGSDIRIWIGRADTVLYADFSLICGEPTFHNRNQSLLTNPTLLVEVLSPSTRDYDLAGKFDLYKKLPSLREYLLVEPEEVTAIHSVKEAGGRWSRKQATERQDVLSIACLGKDLRLSRIYPAT